MDEAKRKRRIERFEQLGEETVRADMATGGHRYIGGPPEVRQLALDWLAEKERQRQKTDVVPRASDNAASSEEPHVTDSLVLQPNFFGVGIDLKKLWRALTPWMKRD